MHAWQLWTMTDKGRLLTDDTNYAQLLSLLQVRAMDPAHKRHADNSAHNFSLRFSPVAAVASLTREMAAVCQHV